MRLPTKGVHTVQRSEPDPDPLAEQDPAPRADQAIERTTNEGVDRAQIIGDGVRWLASWGLRLIIILIATWMILEVIGRFWSAVLPVLLALIASTLLWPPTRWLRKHGFSVTWSAVTALVGGLALIIGIFAALAPSVVDQAPQLSANAIKGVNQIRNWLQGPPLNVRPDQIDDAVNAITQRLQSSGEQIASGVFSGVATAGSVLITLVVALILTFFFVKDGYRFLPWARQTFGRGAGAHFTEVLTRIYGTLGGFIRTQAIVSAVDSTFIGIGLILLGVPLVGPLVVLTFFGGFIPIVGAFVAGTLAVLVALVTKGLTAAIIALIIIIAVQQIEGHVLQPLLQSRSMRLHPAIVLLAIAAGGDTFGIIGAFLAVPLAATAAVIWRYISEQIDLRTGDAVPEDLTPLTAEGKLAQEAAARRTSRG
ncbi:AI-2E family transporter [Branchiibius sp. NY16-3462-2]|uniref:AI-2E family transporter n=1 Tax=Branchiibius sp. NY16-3462-2 TaxID=1807500 RepID=UPI000B0E0EFD|nr:AI-2E family transporter [Branchiibius sp. NY16-3462-2]